MVFINTLDVNQNDFEINSDRKSYFYLLKTNSSKLLVALF